MATRDEVIIFYETHYDAVGCWLLRPGDKVILGDRKNRACRFCGKRPPEVKFRKGVGDGRKAEASAEDRARI
jgi:hypothetical protein